MRITAIVSGRVQGVGYRDFVKNCAIAFGIRGLVRNLGNGSVEVFAQGDAKDIARFVSFLKKERPSAANIDLIEVYDEKHGKYRGPWRELKDDFFADRHGGDL